MNEDPYRHQPPPSMGYYPPYNAQQHPQQHPQQQQQMPPYGQPYNPHMARGPPQENMGPIEGGGLAPLAPGIQPAHPEPMPKVCVENGRRYELVVVQQPRRARMCGFGDKDRRPITPPPCVRLIITDVQTGKEIDCNDIDHGMFVLNVDLWSGDGKCEVNLVRHSTQSPSISNSTSHSYAETKPMYATIQPSLPPPQGVKNEAGQGQQPPYNPYPPNGPPQVNPYPQGPPQHPGQHPGQYQQGYSPSGHPQYRTQNGYQGPPPQQQGPPPGVYVAGPVTGAQIHAQGHAPPQQPQTPYDGQQVQQFRPPHNQQQPQGMFTRNLIGSLAASAFRLTDTDDRIGIWFVLQDLSVRTEGHFRLRFSFVNVGAPTTPTSMATPNGANGLNTSAINTGKAPVLAACFSEVFTVYSAKKFPGVVESTSLSKCFATQGIKIPIRKDGPGGGDKKKGGSGDYDDDD